MMVLRFELLLLGKLWPRASELCRREQEEIVFLFITPSQEFCLIAFLVLFAGGEHSSGEVGGWGGAGSGVDQDVGGGGLDGG
jgi:hypothetical protein